LNPSGLCDAELARGELGAVNARLDLPEGRLSGS